MTALGADKSRSFELGDVTSHPVKAAVTIYEGAACGDDGSGYLRQLTAGDPFRGFAVEKADNAAGAAGAIYGRVRKRGEVELPISALAITDVGKPVYASDSDTFTLTASTNTQIGRVVRWVSTGVGVVAFDVDKAGIGSLVALTDNSTGASGGNTIAAVSSSATAADAVATIAAKVNALIKMFT